MNITRKIVALARRYDTVVAVGHSERCNPVVQAMKRFSIEPKFIEAHRVSPYPFRSTDVGVVLDIMIHDIDIVLSLANSKIRRVDAVGVSVIDGSEDICNARIEFDDGCVANLTASRVTPETLRKIRLFQSDTYISVDYAAQAVKVFQKRDGAITHQELPIQREEPLKQELAAFLDAVRHGGQPVVTGEDAREALRVALAITRKILKGSDPFGH